MKRAVEVVVIGAGVVGASVAYHLAAGGCRDVLVIDQGRAVGAGSTCRATGGYRAQFATEINVRLSLLAREKLLRFHEEIGVDPGYEPAGYLFVARRLAELTALGAALRVQHGAGLEEASLVTPAEAQRLNPALDLEGIVGGAFCPTDGFLRPTQILEGYLGAAQRLGARVALGVTVLGFDRAGARIVAARTSEGEIDARVFVNAAGAWAGRVGALAGVVIPVSPLRRQVASTAPTSALPAAMPMSIFLEDGFHLRVRDGRVLLLWPDDPAGEDPFDARFDPAWLEGLVARAHARVPCLRSVPIDLGRCWAGLYEMSPDKHAILGPAPGLSNFILVNGSSGHGVMHAPALGQLVAEMILDGRARSLDVTALRPSRFDEGEPNPAEGLL